jgi:hypothetical protein
MYDFIDSAYAAVQSLTDEGDQMHRRAVAGKPLVVHLHGWDATANERPAAGGMTERRGGRSVTLRVQGQSIDVGRRATFDTSEQARVFAAGVTAALASMPAPVPGGQHGGPGRNAGRKSADGAQVKRHMVTLDAQTVERLKAADLGDGELSIGIRRAAASLPRK